MAARSCPVWWSGLVASSGGQLWNVRQLFAHIEAVSRGQIPFVGGRAKEKGKYGHSVCICAVCCGRARSGILSVFSALGRALCRHRPAAFFWQRGKHSPGFAPLSSQRPHDRCRPPVVLALRRLELVRGLPPRGRARVDLSAAPWRTLLVYAFAVLCAGSVHRNKGLLPQVLPLACTGWGRGSP